MRYIDHITLTTGHSRRSPRAEVADDVVAVCADLIVRMLATPNATVPLPHPAGYSVGGIAAGKCLVATVWADGPPSEVVATIGVAGGSKCGATLWRALHKWGETPVVTDAARMPPKPWVAAALDAAIVRHMDAAEWLGDFERCLAWAWLERWL